MAALTPVADSDIFWHLAAGREMTRSGSVMRIDPFSLGAAGRPWIDVHWLFQLLSYGVYQLGGLLALVLGKALLVAAGALLLLAAVLRAVRSRDGAAPGAPVAAAALLALLLPAGLLAVRHLLLVRPVILTMLFLAAFLLVLESHRRSGRWRVLLWLPAVQVLWANCQGLWVLGPALVGAYLAGGLLGRLLRAPELPTGGEKQLGGALAMCLVAGMITPYGLRGLLFPLRLLGRIAPDASNVFSQNIAENVPPFILERTMPGQVAPLAAVLGLCAVSFAVARKELVLGRALAALGFAALAFMANRNVLLFFWVGIPVAVMNLAPALARATDRMAAGKALSPGAVSWGVRAVWGLAFLGLTAVGVVAVRAETALGEPAPFRVPAASARIIQQSRGNGRIFNADHYGGYLIWALYPRARPFIDTRLVLRTADEYAEYLHLADAPQRFAAFADRHDFDWVVLPTEFPDRYLGLVVTLYQDTARWRLVYTDGTETLFRRARDPTLPGMELGRRPVVDGVVAEMNRNYGGDTEVLAAARRHLGRLLLSVDEADQARPVLAAAPTGDLDALALLGRCALLLGDHAEAESISQRLLASERHTASGHVLAALLALASQNRQRALEHLRQALAADPYDLEATAVLESLETASSPPAATPQGF